MPTLSQRLGSFPFESRAEILHRYRREYPLPPPINRGGFHGLREEKIGSKVSQKTSFFSFCTVLSLLSLSTVAFSTTTLITDLPTISSTTGSQHNHQPTTKSHRRFLSPFCSPFCFILLLLLLPLLPTTISTTVLTQPLTISTTSGRLNSSPAAKHTPSVPLSLLQIFFSFFLPTLPPTTSSNRRSHYHTTSSVVRPPLRRVALSSAHLQLLQPFGCMQNVNNNCSRSAT